MSPLPPFAFGSLFKFKESTAYPLFLYISLIFTTFYDFLRLLELRQTLAASRQAAVERRGHSCF